MGNNCNAFCKLVGTSCLSQKVFWIERQIIGHNSPSSVPLPTTILKTPIQDRRTMSTAKTPAKNPAAQQAAQAAAASSGGRGGSGRKYSQRYPRAVTVDFRNLSSSALLSYVGHFGIPISNEAPPSELGVAVAQHFETLDVHEDEAVTSFLARLQAGGGTDAPHPPPTASPAQGNVTMMDILADQALADSVRASTYFDGQALTTNRRRWKRRKFAASQGDQVAAKVTRSEENGSWILAYVLRFYPDSETYDVQDEDDTSKLIRLPWHYVMRLSTGQEGWFDKGSKVMAIFPETTSFYRAIVSKHPVWSDGSGEGENGKPRVKELILKFEDDEDHDGKTPHRRVPSRYVIPLPQRYFYEDEDDVDLTAPNSNIGM